MGRVRITVGGLDPAGIFAGMIWPQRFRDRCKETRFKQEWVLTLAQYAAMMLELRGPQRQRGNLNLLYGLLTSSGQVVLTNHTDQDFVLDPANALAGFTFAVDGTLERIDDPDISGEWWSDEPETGIGSSHEVRALSAGKVGTWSASAAADDVWITISLGRTWSVSQTVVGIKTTSATFEAGLDGVETALDSAVLTAVAEVVI